MKKDLQMKYSSNYSFVLKVAAMITAAAGTSCLAENPVVCDHGFAGSYQAVKRFVRQLRQSPYEGCQVTARFCFNISLVWPGEPQRSGGEAGA